MVQLEYFTNLKTGVDSSYPVRYACIYIYVGIDILSICYLLMYRICIYKYTDLPVYMDIYIFVHIFTYEG